jgi:hypothetical protein
MRSLTLAVAIIVATAAAAGAQPRASMTDEARAHWERGLAEYAAKHYEAASAELAACYQREPRRECLFAWAQAERLAGDCEAASGLYRRYLQTDVTAKQAEAARVQLAACEAELATRAAGPPSFDPAGAPRVERPPPRVEPAPPSPPPPAPAAIAEVRSRSPWYRDGWGDVLAGAGAAALTTGAWLYRASGRDASSSAPTYGAYAAQLADARRTRTFAVVALGTGAALVAGGVLHMVLRRDDSTPPRISVGVGAQQLALHYQATF